MPSKPMKKPLSSGKKSVFGKTPKPEGMTEKQWQEAKRRARQRTTAASKRG